MNLEQALVAAADPSDDVRLTAIAPLVEAIDTDAAAAEAMAKLVRDGGNLALAHASASALLRRNGEKALTIFCSAYHEADEQYADHYNDELRDAVLDDPGLLDRLRALAAAGDHGAAEAVEWKTAPRPYQVPTPSPMDRARKFLTGLVAGAPMMGPIGVRDADYLNLFWQHLDGELDAHAFMYEFFRIQQGDERLDDEERNEILQRVFNACEDLVHPAGSRPGEGEISEAQLTAKVGQAAIQLNNRRDDWEGRHARESARR